MSREQPLISIVTPSYNCARYLRECIDSVLAQGYENFEHIIVDGASQDGTIDVLRQYPHLKWISEADKSEGEALNKGVRLARGDIIGCLNADDYYREGVFRRVSREIDPEKKRHVVCGTTHLVNEQGSFMAEKKPLDPVTVPRLLRTWNVGVTVAGSFYAKEVVRDVGFFREDLQFSMEFDYWIRVALKYQMHPIDQVFACDRRRPLSKAERVSLHQMIKNHARVLQPYLGQLGISEQVDFWKDYYIEQLYHLGLAHWCNRLRVRAGLRTRLLRAWTRMR